MAIELIKISEFPQVSEPGDWIVVSDAAGTGYKISKEDFKEWLGTVTVITDKPIALADPAPTMDGVYLPTEPGTYTNAGGLVYDPEGVDAGKYVQFIKNDTVWTKLEVDLPQAENKIPTWTAGTYVQGDQRKWKEKWWEVAVPSTTEEPGTGTDWTRATDDISKTDLTVEHTDNLARAEYRLYDFYIGSTGGKSSGAGWVSYGIPVTPAGEGEPQKYITFDIPNINTGGNSAFYAPGDNPNNTGTAIGLIQSNGSHTNASLPKTVPIPQGAGVLYVAVARPTNVPEDWKETMINEGQEILPYQPADKLTKIAGYDLSDVSGEAYDQSLNTTDDVKFNSVEASLTAIALKVNIPTGAGSPPPEVEVGDMWINTVDGSTKVRLS